MSAREIRSWRLSPAAARAWIDAMIAGGTSVVAPTLVDGLRVFRRIASASEARLDDAFTQWSPKEFLFPRTEPLFGWTVQGDAVRLSEPPDDATEQVLLAVRACDASGLERLDAVLLGDAFYARRRERTTVVSLACERPDAACFCTAVGGSPASGEGSDLQLVQDGDDLIAIALTERGERLAERWEGSWAPAGAEDTGRVLERARTVGDGIRWAPVPASAPAELEARFASPEWSRAAGPCLGCSICTSVCPSCSCFDVQDSGTSACGERCRSWDSCTFARFTRHATGHDPRPDQPARIRQRVLHKFAWFAATHDGRPMCVGCGRCVRLCPAGIDIHGTVLRVLASREEATDASR